MRNCLIIIIFTLTITGCKTRQPIITLPPVVEDNEGPGTNFAAQSTWLLGYVSLFQMTRPPHSEWYESGFRDYRFDEIVAEKIRAIPSEEISITIVLGTWCPDSRREVPRFMRILDYWKFPEEKLTFIGVDDVKLSPIAEYEAFNIEKVPTFIIYQNNNETGRIIEVPVTSLEQDMLNILGGNRK
jgi:thiol-disulfide isomerase/thioredoxin